MKRNIFNITVFSVALLALSGCSFLDPLVSGEYTDELVDDYPSIIHGYMDKAYALLPTSNMYDACFWSEVATDNAVMSDRNHALSLFATGQEGLSFSSYTEQWKNCYQGLFYCNLFLDNNVGYNTRYLVNHESDMVLRRCLQGDAYGMRAYYHAELLKYFGGIGLNGELLGIPLVTCSVDGTTQDLSFLKRASYDDCVKQIIRDCDSALLYLPLANRDFLRETSEPVVVTGAVRYHSLDQVSIHALKSQVYLTWASPAFNPSGDKSRYDLAAKEAAYVMKHKLEKESGMAGGFDPKASLQWSDPNSPEIVFSSIPQQNSNYETALYPHGFGGMAFLGLTQEFVDAFPMANGYPINDPRSGYDSNKPYQGRDPRFYATVLYDEANVVRASNGEVMYTIEVADQGKDAVGLVDTSPTGYYLKKFIYPNWNANDATVQIPNRSNVFFRWTQMCLTFAEAANKVVGPLDKQTYGFSAKEALAYGRARTTTDGMAGLGASSDPYLDECAAAGAEKFDALVRNEWRIETCFEGRRLLDLRRWGSLSDLNVKLHGVEIYRLTNGEKGYDKFEVEERKFRSLWLPIPYQDIRKYSDLIQNQGWENFK